MKNNPYIYRVDEGDRVWFINGITEGMFSVKRQNASFYEDVIGNPDSYVETVPAFIDKMKKSGFILGDEKVEDLIEDKYHNLRRPWEYYMMVLPTYQCNLRCWYCIQSHKDIWITDEIIDALKRRIDSKASDPEIQHLSLSWFGGEPLLCYEQVLEFTKYGREQAEKCGKTFSCSITTNSTLLTEERIQALYEAGVNSYQITIDGNQSTHDRIKQLGNISAFEVALRNIDMIARHTHVNLRFNYNEENIIGSQEMMNQVDKLLSVESRKNISFLMCKVWQTPDEAVSESAVMELFDKAEDMDLKPSFSMMDMCYADQYHFECFLPDGKAGKCDNDSFEKMPGQLQPDGSIIWDERYPSYSDDILKDKETECYSCRYLPICWGMCPKHRGEIKLAGNIPGCKYKDKEQSMHKLLLRRIATMESLKKGS